jgi:hypothetical protein
MKPNTDWPIYFSEVSTFEVTSEVDHPVASYTRMAALNKILGTFLLYVEHLMNYTEKCFPTFCSIIYSDISTE